MTGRRGRRRKRLLDGLKGKRGHWKLKKDALDGTLENSLGKRLLTDFRINERRDSSIDSLADITVLVQESKNLPILK